MSKTKNTDYFALLPNNFFITHKKLSLTAKQLLLELELRAGNSRQVFATKKELADSCGCDYKTVLRAINKFKQQKLLFEEDGVLILGSEQPKHAFFKAPGFIVNHPTWDTWQRQAVLFILSQFKTKHFTGSSIYTLNRTGRQCSMRNYCSIQGRGNTERDTNLKEFLQRLFNERVLIPVSKSSRSLPATCMVNTSRILQQIQDATSGHAAAVNMTNGNAPDMTKGHAGYDKRTRGICQTVTQNMTNGNDIKEKIEDPQDPVADPEKPSRGQQQVAGGFFESKAQPEEINSAKEETQTEKEFIKGIPVEDIFKAPLQEKERGNLTNKRLLAHSTGKAREFLQEVLENTSKLGNSKRRISDVLADFDRLLEELPAGIISQDLNKAINSRAFHGLKQLSLGLLLSSRYFPTFKSEIETAGQKRLNEQEAVEMRNAEDKKLDRKMSKQFLQGESAQLIEDAFGWLRSRKKFNRIQKCLIKIANISELPKEKQFAYFDAAYSLPPEYKGELQTILNFEEILYPAKRSQRSQDPDLVGLETILMSLDEPEEGTETEGMALLRKERESKKREGVRQRIDDSLKLSENPVALKLFRLSNSKSVNEIRVAFEDDNLKRGTSIAVG